MQSIKPSKISIVLATYNGADRIIKQMESLRDQTRKADEVLIIDDCSTDDTVKLVLDFIRFNSLDTWTLHINETNLGWKRNFMEGMRKATGDLIFPCDQDDTWYPEKIYEMAAAMEANNQILVLSCDYRVICEPGAIQPVVYQKSKEEQEGIISQYQFTRHFLRNPVPGCTCAVRTSFFKEIEPMWFDTAPHDEFIWVMATMVDGAWFYNRELMDFIRHESNASAIRRKDIAMQLENIDHFRQLIGCVKNLARHYPDKIGKDKQKHILRAEEWCAMRAKAVGKRSAWIWLSMAPRWGYYNSVPNCLSDLWLILFGSFSRHA